RAARMGLVALVATLAAALPLQPSAHAASKKRSSAPAQTSKAKNATPATILIAQDGALQPLSEKAPRLGSESAEAEFGRALQALLKKSLRPGITALLVVDAKTGTPIFALRPDEAMNPASNVKMIATATALSVLGTEHRFTTQLLAPANGTEPQRIKGDVYLLGSYDPTFDTDGLHALAERCKAQGITRIDGNIVFGDSDRDGPYGARVPIDIVATARGKAPDIVPWPGLHDTVVINRAKTVRKGKPRIAVVQKRLADGTYQITVSGTIAATERVTKTVAAGKRALFAGEWLRWELGQVGIEVTGSVAMEPLAHYVQRLASQQQFAVTLADRSSLTVGELVSKINKRSINWLADRLVAVAAGFAHNVPPALALGVAEMRVWLQAHAAIAPNSLTIDTGSGLSYRTKISPQQLVTVIRDAAGFTADAPSFAPTWVQSLSVGGKDGTLARRFLAPQFTNRIHAKTGTLSNVVALSGLLLTNPERPLAFALVTNKHAPAYKTQIRRAHEQVISALTAYVVKRDGVAFIAPATVAAPATVNATNGTDGSDDESSEPSSDTSEVPAATVTP
nr:D-alanyl-D-alanine carboxypeptidase [Kofleriaceae bacterium]